jgi:hypothetical protein
MMKRHIPTSDSCIFCGREESIEHSLLCQFAHEVWREVKKIYTIHLDRHDFMPRKFWLFDFLAQATDVEATVLLIGCWHIWEAGNDARNNQAFPNPRRTCGKITAYVNMVIHHCYRQPTGTRREAIVHPKWSSRPPGEFLVNCDAALFEDRRCMAAGVVIRDHTCNCLVAGSEHLCGFTTPKLAEALAMRQAVTLARDKGFTKATFASDCHSLINCLKSSSPDRSQLGSMVADIRFLTKDFVVASFCHVSRVLNEAT